MTHNRTYHDPEWGRTPPAHTPRLRLKPKAPESGRVDGAWWPHTDDLTKELPDLLAVLSVRLGRIVRVLYNLSQWAGAPAKLPHDGRTVRLDGYRRQPVNTVDVMGIDGSSIVLWVVPPHTDPEGAREAMLAAAGRSDTSTVNSLLAISMRNSGFHSRSAAPAEQERWESEGGATISQRTLPPV